MSHEVICPECGTSSPETAKFCLKCGHRMEGPLPAPPSPETPRPGWRRWFGVMAIGVVVVLVAAAVAGVVLGLSGGKLRRTAEATASAAPTTDEMPAESAARVSPTLPAEPTSTPVRTNTPVPTATPPPTTTPIPTATPITPTPTPSPTVTPTPSLTPTPRPTPIPYCYFGTLERIEDYTYPLISIHGIVVDRKGKGVKGVRVRVSAYEWYNEVLTGWDGLFIIDGLAQPIEWTISLPQYNASVKVPIEKHGQKAVVRFEEKPCR